MVNEPLEGAVDPMPPPAGGGTGPQSGVAMAPVQLPPAAVATSDPARTDVALLDRGAPCPDTLDEGLDGPRLRDQHGDAGPDQRDARRLVPETGTLPAETGEPAAEAGRSTLPGPAADASAATSARTGADATPVDPQADGGATEPGWLRRWRSRLSWIGALVLAAQRFIGPDIKAWQILAAAMCVSFVCLLMLLWVVLAEFAHLWRAPVRRDAPRLPPRRTRHDPGDAPAGHAGGSAGADVYPLEPPGRQNAVPELHTHAGPPAMPSPPPSSPPPPSPPPSSPPPPRSRCGHAVARLRRGVSVGWRPVTWSTAVLVALLRGVLGGPGRHVPPSDIAAPTTVAYRAELRARALCELAGQSLLTGMGVVLLARAWGAEMTGWGLIVLGTSILLPFGWHALSADDLIARKTTTTDERTLGSRRGWLTRRRRVLERTGAMRYFGADDDPHSSMATLTLLMSGLTSSVVVIGLLFYGLVAAGLDPAVRTGAASGPGRAAPGKGQDPTGHEPGQDRVGHGASLGAPRTSPTPTPTKTTPAPAADGEEHGGQDDSSPGSKAQPCAQAAEQDVAALRAQGMPDALAKDAVDAYRADTAKLGCPTTAVQLNPTTYLVRLPNGQDPTAFVLAGAAGSSVLRTPLSSLIQAGSGRGTGEVAGALHRTPWGLGNYQEVLYTDGTCTLAQAMSGWPSILPPSTVSMLSAAEAVHDGGVPAIHRRPAADAQGRDVYIVTIYVPRPGTTDGKDASRSFDVTVQTDGSATSPGLATHQSDEPCGSLGDDLAPAAAALQDSVADAREARRRARAH